MDILKTIVNEKTKGRACREGFNTLTIEMQDYFKGKFARKHDRTYIYDPHEPQTKNDRIVYPLRHVGSTVGHIEVDENGIIFDIVIYEEYMSGKHIPNTAGPYKLKVREAVKKYIGWKYECIEYDFSKLKK